MSRALVLKLAAIPVALWLVLHLLGARAATVVLSGTAPLGLGSLLGLAYLVAWLMTVLVAPVVVIAAILGRAVTLLRPARDRALE